LSRYYKEETNRGDQFWLNEYGLEQWDSRRIEAEISFARQRSQKYNVPVWCGEFGVIRDQPDPMMQAAWLHDVREAFEKDKKHRIGWAMWDYRANFGLAIDVNGTRLPDSKVVKALGIRY
jgi:endoglucanase